jgi:uncharacterized protein
MKIVLDTNVLVSAIVFGGNPRVVMESVLEGVAQLILSREMLDELEGVLSRKKFGMSSQIVSAISHEVETLCVVVTPVRRISVMESDPYDNMVLECAVEGKVDYIVSGDAHLLDLGEFEGIKIVNPTRFLEILKKR